ncbi:hypothetical protein DPMN_029567 [Dreissena polymorpha]|uniref:Uncharacterized protein n=1 Tax=Dreissena polymorpha TaxID=45954 RepID=A0A9D4RGD1_DREPO|nr:hypothetical protein DPMN_029567 [Dreissena polymorpha]
MRNGNKSVTEGRKYGRNFKLATICSPKIFGDHKNEFEFDVATKKTSLELISNAIYVYQEPFTQNLQNRFIVSCPPGQKYSAIRCNV